MERHPLIAFRVLVFRMLLEPGSRSHRQHTARANYVLLSRSCYDTFAKGCPMPLNHESHKHNFPTMMPTHRLLSIGPGEDTTKWGRGHLGLETPARARGLK